MKKLLVLLLVPLLSGCSFLENSSVKFSNTVDTVLRQDPGWNASGYIIRDDSREIKIGIISSEILYGVSAEPKDFDLEESVKDEGFIIGIFLKKTF